jgi:hypothetical protein
MLTHVARASQTAPPLLDASAQSATFGPLQATRNVTFALRSGGGSTRAGRFAFNRSRTRAIHSDGFRPHGVHAGRAQAFRKQQLRPPRQALGGVSGGPTELSHPGRGRAPRPNVHGPTPVLETMIVEIGKGVQQGLFCPNG